MWSGEVAAAAASVMSAARTEKHDRVRLDQGVVQHPRVAGADPADGAGIDAVVEQPHACVGGGLARPGYDVLRRRSSQVDQVVDGDRMYAVRDAERRWGGRGDLPGKGGERRPRAADRAPRNAARTSARRTDPRRGSRNWGRRKPGRTRSGARAAPGRSTHRSPAPSPARTGRLRARPPGSDRNRAASTPRHRTKRPGAAARRGTRPASARRRRGGGRP